jgi:pilus assembly protein CpaF
VHANDTREALDRIELMIALSGAELATSVARRYVANALDLIVHISRLSTGERKVMRISEVIGVRNGEYEIEDIFAYRMSGIESGRADGAFYATGHEPRVLGRLASLGMTIDRGLFNARELELG